MNIMECKEEENGQKVILVFYDVDPSHVRYQSESFEEAFAKHESRYKDDVEMMQKVQGWRIALTVVSNLKGYDICDRIESECIRELVDDVSSKLCKTSSSYLHDIMGIDTHLEKGASFLADVKETNTNEIHSLQNTLLSELLRKDKKYVNNKDGKVMIAHRLRFMKVLVVLDDINHHDHWDQYALKDKAPDEHIKKLSLEVVSHAKGLPLALRLWGILLHNEDATMWRDVVDMIKRESSPDIVKNLKISFEGLPDKEKTIFLDIACFFRGRGKDKTIKILERYDLGAHIRLHGLIEKSLVFISKYETIQMHDLVQDMGRYVAKMQKDSGKPSRLWNIEDFEDVVSNTQGTMSVEAIWCSYIKKLCFSKEAMKNMKKLRILCTCDGNEFCGITSSSSSNSNCH